MKIGDRVKVLLHSRCSGYIDTGGGWSSDWLDATIIKINKKTATVRTDIYYYGYFHNLPFRRIKEMQ